MTEKAKLEEVYVPEEQAVYSDPAITEKIATMKIVQKNLVKSFVVSSLDRDDNTNEFMKIDCAHAVGVLEGRGNYEGINSIDETWIYEYINGNGNKNGGIAVVRNKKVIDFYHIWETAV